MVRKIDKKNCWEELYDSEVISEIKSSTKKGLLKRLKPESIHYVALFLNPPFKDLKFCSQEQKTNVLATIKAMVEEYNKELECCCEDEVMDEPSKSATNPFLEYMDTGKSNSQPNEQDDIEDEIRIYLKKK